MAEVTATSELVRADSLDVPVDNIVRVNGVDYVWLIGDDGKTLDDLIAELPDA